MLNIDETVIFVFFKKNQIGNSIPDCLKLYLKIFPPFRILIQRKEILCGNFTTTIRVVLWSLVHFGFVIYPLIHPSCHCNVWDNWINLRQQG